MPNYKTFFLCHSHYNKVPIISEVQFVISEHLKLTIKEKQLFSQKNCFLCNNCIERKRKKL